MKYHAKVQEIIDKVKSGYLEPKRYVIQIEDGCSVSINFYLNKQIWYIDNYKNNEFHGKSEGWFSNGNKQYSENWKNGKLIEDVNL